MQLRGQVPARAVHTTAVTPLVTLSLRWCTTLRAWNSLWVRQMLRITYFHLVIICPVLVVTQLVLFFFKADDDTTMPNCNLTSSHIPEVELTLLIRVCKLFPPFSICIHSRRKMYISATAVLFVCIILFLCSCMTGWYCLHRDCTAYK